MGVVRVLPVVVSSIREVPTSAILATVASFVSRMFLDLMSLCTTCMVMQSEETACAVWGDESCLGMTPS